MTTWLLSRITTATATTPPRQIEYLGRAGQQAVRRSAYLEAIGNLKLGSQFLMKLPETDERDRQELELQAALGPSLMETKAIPLRKLRQFMAG